VGALIIQISCKQAEGVKEWGAIRGSIRAPLDAESPDEEFLTAANKLQVRLMCHQLKPHVFFFHAPLMTGMAKAVCTSNAAGFVGTSPLSLKCCLHLELRTALQCTAVKRLMTWRECSTWYSHAGRLFEGCHRCCVMQARLVLGVRAEQDAGKEAQLSLYRKCALHLRNISAYHLSRHSCLHTSRNSRLHTSVSLQAKDQGEWRREVISPVRAGRTLAS